jgi:hypothetical protein
VRKFFSGYKIKAGGVSFIMHADGRPTGMAFIEFATPQEAVRAMVRQTAAVCAARAPSRPFSRSAVRSGVWLLIRLLASTLLSAGEGPRQVWP